MNLQELCVQLVGLAVKKHLEPKCNNVPLWDNGFRALTEGLVQAGVPPVTGDDVAAGMLRMMGVRSPRIVGRGRIPSQVQASDCPGQYAGPVIDVTGGPAS